MLDLCHTDNALLLDYPSVQHRFCSFSSINTILTKLPLARGVSTRLSTSADKLTRVSCEPSLAATSPMLLRLHRLIREKCKFAHVACDIIQGLVLYEGSSSGTSSHSHDGSTKAGNTDQQYKVGGKEGRQQLNEHGQVVEDVCHLINDVKMTMARIHTGLPVATAWRCCQGQILAAKQTQFQSACLQPFV